MVSLRRTVAALCAVMAGVAAGGVAVQTPVTAADHVIRVRGLPGSFRAGGPSGALTVTVTAKRKADCVRVLRTLRIGLDGLTAERVRVERLGADGARRLRAVTVPEGVQVIDGTPDRQAVCRGRDSVARYRFTFLAGAPGGRARFVVEAFTVAGKRLGSAVEDRRVIAASAASAAKPAPAPTPSSSDAPAAELTVTPTGRADGAVPVDGAAGPAPTTGVDAAPSGGTSTPPTLLMALGVLMLVGGGTLLGLLLWRRRLARTGRSGGGPATGPRGGDGDTVLLPTVPG